MNMVEHGIGDMSTEIDESAEIDDLDAPLEGAEAIGRALIEAGKIDKAGLDRARRVAQGDVGLEKIMRLQMDPAVFPVPLDKLAAELIVTHVESQEVDIDGFTVRTVRLRHPGHTLGYRLTPQDGGASFAYITDNELGSGGDYDVGPAWRQELVDFLSGTEVLVHDAMYTPAELDRHRGWGHSSNHEAVALAQEAGVGRLVLFHHLPEHSDEDMDRFVQEARITADELGQPLEVMAATEGLELTL